MSILEIAKAIAVWPEVTRSADFKQGLSSQMLLIEDDDGGLAWIDEEAKRDFIRMASSASKPGKRLPADIRRCSDG